MESLPHFQTPSSFRSRRSHTSLQHISLAPLTSRFPLDDDDGPDFDISHSHHDDSDFPRRYTYNPHPATTSYLASSSVPTTPPILSDSRNTSYTNLPKRKTMSNLTQIGDLNLNQINPGSRPHHRRAKSYTHQPKLSNTSERQDSEWLLRAGLALSSSAREEKGQSWLVKRDSSTSLVSDANPDNEHKRRSHHSHHSYSRRQRSGLSTPAVLSRRPSSSHPASRFGSRIDLSMTAAGPAVHDQETGVSDDAVGLVPDFVDENLRNEMASISSWSFGHANTPSQRASRVVDDRTFGTPSRRSSAFDASFSESISEFSDSETDSEDEVDEDEMQRLTRQRGLGLGSWVDRLVEWTLFSVEEEVPAAVAEPARHHRHVGDIHHQSQAVELENNSNQEEEESETESDRTPVRDEEDIPTVLSIEGPGEQGGWSDVGWFLRVAKSVAI
ncbi:hypothetical protein AJ79_07259 [Helicocarpus griseus UAMH5409]|uniref:Uncharacterized protein n=1 Tax=Helicocarpus griseus UAMH5409 TaxID=1447875 RepID=A0A2B7X4S1_9EURO|nr:hypothetical protein AJ79_07259 [Helicocarpus griseus UAMH5409]